MSDNSFMCKMLNKTTMGGYIQVRSNWNTMTPMC